MARRIDVPLERADRTFNVPDCSPANVRMVDRILADFVIHLRATGTYPRRHLSREEARAQAISLLSSPQFSGDPLAYELSVLAAHQGHVVALEEPMRALTEAIRLSEHARYRQWVYASTIDPLAWKTKVAIVELVLADRDIPQLDMARSRLPASLASELPVLLDTYFTAKRAAAKVQTGLAGGVF